MRKQVPQCLLFPYHGSMFDDTPRWLSVIAWLVFLSPLLVLAASAGHGTLHWW